jgi:D-alanyl-D-alanine carboxypeptidase/D-alanyl-D-alanine-endopeptidase (penicillin-binding protein 4)
MVVVTLALICVYTIGAGIAVARLLPARIALLRVSQVSDAGLLGSGPALPGAPGLAPRGRQAGAAVVAAQISGLIAAGGLGHTVGALVTDLATGRVLYALNATTGFTPASTTKLATAVAALDVLGPGATFTTSVVAQAAGAGGASQNIVLVGGGDPTLAAGRYPSGDYPQPATLSSLAAATARALKAKKVGSVRLGYDGSLFGGPVLALGWPAFGTANNYIASGNVAPIAGLEVDQGRLSSPGVPQDKDFGGTALRSLAPAQDAARFFARFLRRDGIAVRGSLVAVAVRAHLSKLAVVAAVHSPPLAQIVQQMLAESNNVIAETLARQVAVATGRPGTFSGAARAVMAVDARLGVTGIAINDGSGLSTLDRISPLALVRLVRLAAETGPDRLRPAITGLPIAGFYGTLGPLSFFGPFGPAALGTVRAKTGNLTGVATMAGLAYTRTGQLLAFAFMGNNIPNKLGLQPEMTLARLATALASCGCR